MKEELSINTKISDEIKFQPDQNIYVIASCLWLLENMYFNKIFFDICAFAMMHT